MRPKRLVTRAELRAKGMSRRAIEHRLAGRRLFVVHRGVYAVGRPDLSAQDQRLAAVLALGPTAVLSHTSAGQVWDLTGGALHPIHVTLPGSGRSQREGIRVHRTTALHPEDTLRFDDIPITSVDRTLLDLAALSPRPRLARAVEQAERLQRLDLAGLARVLERNPGAPGAAKLRDLLAGYTTAPATRSELERAFLDFVERHGLPRPLLNVRVGGVVVDAYWPAWRLVVELDSVTWHLTRGGFERDRVRDAMLQRLGLRVLRITDARLRRAPAAVLEDVLALAATA